MRATVRTLLAYPLLLSGVSSLVVTGLVTFVLPKFVDIFGQFEVALPVITQLETTALPEKQATPPP